jgi:hypothetical protein
MQYKEQLKIRIVHLHPNEELHFVGRFQFPWNVFNAKIMLHYVQV